MNSLTATAVGKRYRARWAVRDCGFAIPEGKVVALVGPNGAGKSTLLRMAAGLARPTTGELKVFGTPVRGRIHPDVAFLAALHVLCIKLFYRYTSDSCLEIDVKSVVFGSQAPGLNDTAIAKAVDEHHRRWSEQLPQEPGDLWEALLAFDTDSRHALFAHCVALSINAVHES